MLKIGDFSRLSSISIRMLRHYDEMGLLVPSSIDEQSGYRYYNPDQIAVAGKIQKLKSLGFSLAMIKEIMENQDDTSKLEQYFRIREQEILDELALVNTQAKLLEQASRIMKEDEDKMKYNVVLKTIPARKVMSVRSVIPSYYEEGMLWQELYQEAMNQQVKSDKNGLGMAIFHDQEYKTENVDVEVQSPVIGEYQDTDKIKFLIAPEAEVASVTFQGSYEQMNAIGQAIAEWLEINQYEIAGPMFNIYHVSPAQDPNPENWITEACYQVKKK